MTAAEDLEPEAYRLYGLLCNITAHLDAPRWKYFSTLNPLRLYASVRHRTFK
jgi:hypothetical protein